MNSLDFLDFEQPIAELDAKIEALRLATHDTGINIHGEIEGLEKRKQELIKKIFTGLTPWQIVRLARHPLRPHTSDYIETMFTDFHEIYGDRHYSKGSAIIGGLARLDGKPVMVIGQQKGRNTKENLERNFGMSNPEEYRRALRLMRMAEKFKIPVVTFIDTAGAFPGLEAEEHNQSEAIATNLKVMSQLRVPIVCVVIGEGGSGGALALGVGDYVVMLQYSVYSVISPEGCASILWRSQDKVEEAAQQLNLTADRLLKLKLIDQVVAEPLGGAHRDLATTAASLKKVLVERLKGLAVKPVDDLLDTRYQKILSYGRVDKNAKSKPVASK
jgi:acetyl-CoA carboxylase carboxyl transferase subunit alpha